MKRYLQIQQDAETLRQKFDHSGFSIKDIQEIVPEEIIRIPIKIKYGKKINRVYRGFIHSY